MKIYYKTFKKTIMENKQLLELINSNGGFTIDLKIGIQPQSGFCVALKDFEQITINNNNNLDKILSNYIVNHKPKLFNENYYLGCWVNDNKVYLDIVTIVKDLKLAVKLAKINKQIAIYDLDNQKEIFIDNLIFAENNDQIFTGNFENKSDLFNLLETCYKMGFDFVNINSQVFSLPVQKIGTDYQKKSDRQIIIKGLVNYICKR